MRYVLLLLLLANCASTQHPAYTPTFSQTPKDQAKYQSDLTECRKGAYYTAPTQYVGDNFPVDSPLYMASLIQRITDDTPQETEVENRKHGALLIDICMKRKGYKLK